MGRAAAAALRFRDAVLASVFAGGVMAAARFSLTALRSTARCAATFTQCVHSARNRTDWNEHHHYWVPATRWTVGRVVKGQNDSLCPSQTATASAWRALGF
jgi:hypothetical protein